VGGESWARLLVRSLHITSSATLNCAELSAVERGMLVAGIAGVAGALKTLIRQSQLSSGSLN
jgi:hypothetical protein